MRACVCLCVWFAGNLQGSASDSGWDLCADGPPVLKVVVAVLSQRTDGGPGEENSGDDFRMSWLQHISALNQPKDRLCSWGTEMGGWNKAKWVN